MNQIRHLSIVLACLVIALPSPAFATCCCSLVGSSQCCLPIDETGGCCGPSQLGQASCCTSTSANQCDLECECSIGKAGNAIGPERQNADFDAAISFPFCEVVPALSTSRQGFCLYACRPPSHNRRQALLCVWLK